MTNGSAGQTRGPSHIRLHGWTGILLRVWKAFNRDNVSIIGGGVAFSVLLAIFPALAAFVALYGLVADVSQAPRHVAALAALLPRDVAAFIGSELIRLAALRGRGLSLALFVGVAISLWSANGAMRTLMVGLNVAYEARERRGLIKASLVSLALTFGLLIFLFGAVFAFSAGAVVGALLGPDAQWTINVLRWPILLMAGVGGLCLLYRFGPCRPFARWRWITWGSGAATLVWLAMSGVFSLYLSRFAHLGRTYGSLATMIALMLWIWLSAVIVLMGAELNCEIERTQRDGGAPPARR
ncbi:MAG: YihY/virulence factor BrkB family protein [Caulobacteraceae bacterium]